MMRWLAALTTVLGLAAILLVSSSSAAWAWDDAADQVVATLAYERLDPGAKSKVNDILTQAPSIGRRGCRMHALSDVSDVVQCLRGDKADFMKGIVYDPLPLCGVLDRSRACDHGRCASDTLGRELATLKDGSVSPDRRAAALAAVVYLTAELHQPLHAADNEDRSGDRVRVVLPGSHDRRLTLYSVWDEDLVALAIGDAQTGARYLRPLVDLHAADWSAGDVAAWVADSHHVAATEVYAPLPDPPACGKTPDAPEPLSRAYVDQGAQTVRLQLAKAAVRLASLLNATLG